MFKNKQKYFLISVLLMILFLAASGTAFGVDLNENLEVLEVSVCKDNLENSQNDIVGSSEITLNGGKFSDIQKAIDERDQVSGNKYKGLMDDVKENEFRPYRYVTKLQTCLVWDKAKEESLIS